VTSSPGIIVSTGYGRLAAAPARADGVARFLGIPYAAPPVGPLRWRPSRRPEPWDGVRSAAVPGPVPLQTQPPTISIMYQSNFADGQAPVMSEDCLYLNVWTPDPASAARLPVMVWVPGGGNRFGSGSQRLYAGENLASQGVVVVSVSYRLGPLGFLVHPGLRAEDPAGAAGNYALSDVIAALNWVQENVTAFGGDPARVTLFGNSAGSRHVNYLMAAPRCHQLFHQAIGQSGGAFGTSQRSTPTLDEAGARGLEFARERGADGIEALRSLSGAEVLLGGDADVVVDGEILTDRAEAVFDRGEQLKIPLLVGTNADDGSVHAPFRSAADFRALARSKGTLGEAILRAYPADTEETARQSNRAFFGDERFGWPAWKWACVHASSGQPVRMYSFDKAPPVPAALGIAPPRDGAGGYGAYHTAELFYVWNSFSVRDWEWAEGDRELGRVMSAAWVRFAATGDPSGPSALPWPTIDPASGTFPAMRFGEATQLGSGPDLARMDVQDCLARPLLSARANSHD
jgi:para-nitrobenzyl esterase